MTVSKLGTIPATVFEAIVAFLPFETTLALSSTNSAFRNALIPHIFRAVRISNWPHDEASLRNVARKYGPCITELQFTGYGSSRLPPSMRRAVHYYYEKHKEPGAEVDRINASGDLLHEVAREALSGALLPAVRTVRITFDFAREQYFFDQTLETEEDDEGTITTLDFYDRAEAPGTVAYKESISAWRRSMAQAWAALVQNTRVTKLVTPSLIPRITSIFLGGDWAAFLGRLEEFELDVWGTDGELGLWLNQKEGYRQFESQLGEYFFRHLDSARRLKLSVPWCYPFGLMDSRYDSVLSLQPTHIPRLRRLELHHIFISPNLANFILSKRQNLVSLHLHDCYASSESLAGPTTWAAFFDRIQSEATQLLQLEIRYRKKVPLTFKDEYPELLGMFPSHWIEHDQKAAEWPEQEDPARRAFGYAFLHPRGGKFNRHVPATWENYVRGDDSRAYDKLMATLQSNRRWVTRPD
ncbi:hypothetical protein GQ53DRAFT_743190 [Thozetella sp. PMI_491]|nr:hypothetical protein GQ53DRAFT_743190 [Thozetella sp. PMI_491]